MKPKKPGKMEQEEEHLLPDWLRYTIIVVSILWLLSLAFRPGGAQRTDFPSHVPPTVR